MKEQKKFTFIVTWEDGEESEFEQLAPSEKQAWALFWDDEDVRKVRDNIKYVDLAEF